MDRYTKAERSYLDVTADRIAGILLSAVPEQRTELMRRAYSISGVCPNCGQGNPAEPRLGCTCGTEVKSFEAAKAEAAQFIRKTLAE